MPQLGMDTAAIADLANQLDSSAARIGHVIGTVENLVDRAVQEWEGHGAVTFSGEWHNAYKPALLRAEDAVAGLAAAARNNVVDQDRASGAAAPAALAGANPAPSGLPALVGLYHRLDQGVSADSAHQAQIGADRHIGGAASVHGVPVTGRLDAFATAQAAEHAHAGVSAHGAEASFAGSAGVAAGLAASGMIGNRSASLSGTGEAEAEARADVDARATFNRDGLAARADGDAFAGVQADASATGQVGGVGGTVGAHAYAGIGVHADADAQVTTQEIKASVTLGAALGIGGGVTFGIDVKPDQVLDAIKHIHLW